VPNDQPTSHSRGNPAALHQETAAATSYRSASPLSNVPPLRPRSDAVPRVLNLSTARPASAGSR
jgi:hypothetical protein